MERLGRYGALPKVVGKVDIEFPEFMFYLYLPIKMAGVGWIDMRNIPHNLDFLMPLLKEVNYEEDDYIYITAKNMWYEVGGTYNRDGWHSDGFMTDDTSYIWSDGASTEFITGEFWISQDHEESLDEFALVGEGRSTHRFPPKDLLMLNEKVIHRPPGVIKSGMRGFIKVSISKDKYNLKGNSHNNLIDYNWESCNRKSTRNDPACKVISN